MPHGDPLCREDNASRSEREYGSEQGLNALMARAAACIAQPSAGQARVIEQLRLLESRLAAGRLHIAVLGQFKRGKSSLLNAILGVSALPTGITPVTSIPTFVRAGARDRVLLTVKGQPQEIVPGDGRSLSEVLGDYASEDANPHNRRGVERVEVEVASRHLGPGIVVIDTPGVGSMFLHNTKAAEAIIAESDVALFVVSADPPITEVEVNYLHRIRGLIAKVVVVLNKVDFLSPQERATALAFLRRMLEEHAGLANPVIFAVSARRALEAKQAGAGQALDASGLPALEAHLSEVVGGAKHQIIADIVRRRAAALVADLRLQTGIELEALRMPLAALQEKLATFEQSAKAFRAEQVSLSDLTEVERRGVLRELEAETERLWNEMRQALRARIWALLEEDEVERTQARIGAEIVAHFDAELRRVVPLLEQRFAERLAAHQKRADALIDQVRRTAADLMQISVTGSAGSDVIEIEREPYWVEPEAPASLIAISTETFARFLPKSVRRRRAERQLIEATDRAVLRNIGNLEWSMRQNIEDAFRRFEWSVGERLAHALEETLGVMQVAVERHRQRSQDVKESVERCLAGLAELDDILMALNFVPAEPGVGPRQNLQDQT